MTIRHWEGVALIIGNGYIERCIINRLTSITPNFDVIMCGRNLNNHKAIYLDFEKDHSFYSFEKQFSLFEKPFRLVINTCGLLHSNLVIPEKRLSHINRSNRINIFSINAIAPILFAKSIENFIRPEYPFSFANLSARVIVLVIIGKVVGIPTGLIKLLRINFLKPLLLSGVENLHLEQYLLASWYL